MLPARGRASEYERADPFGEVQGEHLRDASAHGRAVDGGPIHAEAVEHLGGVGGEARGRQLVEPTAAAARDRKSTRLNSSHVAISYAVFCLKKNTRQHA